jgi:hypothetical protein
VLDEAAITSAEDALGITANLHLGFHDPEFGEAVVKPARMELNASAELRRAGKYLFGSYWFSDDFTRVKQLRTLFRLLGEHDVACSLPALRLGTGEATVLFIVAVLSIASWRNQRSEDEFRQFIGEELATGVGDPRSLRLLLRRADELQPEQIESVHEAYQQAGAARVPFVVKSLEAEALTPPEWVDAFIDLATRFSRRPHTATSLLRWADLWAADLLGAGNVRTTLRQLFPGQERDIRSALELVIAFLTRVWSVPTHLFGGAEPPSMAVAVRPHPQLPLGDGVGGETVPSSQAVGEQERSWSAPDVPGPTAAAPGDASPPGQIQPASSEEPAF